MKSEQQRKKRKMDVPTGGDKSSTVPNSYPSATKSPCTSQGSGSASGDSQNSREHKYVTFVKNLDIENGGEHSSEDNSVEWPTSEIHTTICSLGDVWHYQVPIPLSAHPSRLIRTGSKSYDVILSELPSLGFRPLKLICKGRSGTVLLAQDIQTNTSFNDLEARPVAIKLHIGRKRKYTAHIRRDSTEEMIIHQRLQHHNVVKMLSALNYKGRQASVLEFCESGSLEQLLNAHSAGFITETVARKYLTQIHSALEYIHWTGIAHRDLCPANILVSFDNILKLADFGHAVWYRPGDNLCDDYSCGTPGYQAPEIMISKPYNPRISDLWSLGSVLYVMVMGRLPYGRIEDEVEVKSLGQVQFPDPQVLVLSNEMKELIQGMLAYVPSVRYTLNRVKNSAWMSITSNKVQLGNFYLVRQPQKVSDSETEREIKAQYGI